jgi:outer membrane protein TolC
VESAAGFETRSLDDPALKKFLETNLHRSFDDWPLGSWNFSTLTLVAFYYHPSLAVARAQWAVAEAGIKSAGGRPNPILTVTPGYSSNPAQGISPWFPMVSIDVPIETAGKRRKRIRHAEHLSEAARLNIYTVAWQVRSQLRSVLLEWSASQRRADLLQRQVDLQDDLVKRVEQRLAAGAVASADVTPARVARLKLIADLAEARRQAATAQVRLGDALGLPAKKVASLQLAPDPPLPRESAETLSGVDARSRALRARPDVLTALAEYAAAESALALASRKDGGLTPAQLAWVLSEIEIGDDADVPGGVSSAELRAFIAELQGRFARLAFPLQGA